MSWLVSRYPRETALAIKEMKRSGMGNSLLVVNIPILTGLNAEIDETVSSCITAHSALVAAQNLNSSDRSLLAVCFEAYATNLGNYAGDLAKYAGAIDPSLANSASTEAGEEIDRAITVAKHNPEIRTAVQAAELAKISMLAMMAMALSVYAMRVHTAVDRVYAMQFSQGCIAKCDEFKKEYNL